MIARNLARVALVMVTVAVMALALASPAAAATEVPLLTCHDTNIGAVTISDDGSTITVTYRTSTDWIIEETHLAVAMDPNEIPQTRLSNPKVEQFDPGTDPIPVDDHTVTYEIDVSSIPEFEDGDDTVYIAAHARVTCTDGSSVLVCAWGQGIDFDGPNWGMYIQYTLDGGIVQPR